MEVIETSRLCAISHRSSDYRSHSRASFRPGEPSDELSPANNGPGCLLLGYNCTDIPTLFPDRELEVLRIIGQGVKTADIAKQPHLSIKTVETYRDRIRQELDLNDGTDLVRYAARWVLENE